jgi:hypothetical protein
MSDAAHPVPSLKTEWLPALFFQIPILVLASMVLDGGAIAQVCFYALVAFWVGVVVLHFRRRGVLSRVDLLLIRWGYILACIISFFITRWIWQLRGYGQYL